MKLTKIVVGENDPYEVFYTDGGLQYDEENIDDYIAGFKDGYKYYEGNDAPRIEEETLYFNKPDWIYSNFQAVFILEDYLRQLKEEGFVQTKE